MTDRLPRWLPFLLLGLVLLAWLWPLLAGQTLFWGLPALQFYPWRSYAFDQLQSGLLPFENPYNGGGAPLLANYQTAIFYPPNWLHLLLPHVPAMNLLAVGHIVWAGIGMWVFAGMWRLPDFGRAVSMLAFALGGYLIGRLGSFPTVAVAAWFPWIYWAIHRVMQQPGWWRISMLAGATALLLLAGHAQTAYYVLLAAAAYTLWLGFQRRWNLRARLFRWAAVLIGALLGVMLAAPQLLPTLELLQDSARADGLHYEWTTNFSYSLARGLTMLSPNLYGTPADGSYITEGAYFEDAAYIGLLPLVAAGFAVLEWIRRGRKQPSADGFWRSVPFWLGLIVPSFLLALGKNGFLFPLFYEVVPTFKQFQGPVRWLILMVFALSMLAGIGVSGAWHKGKWTVFWSRLAAAGGAGVVIVAVFIAPRILPKDIDALQVMVRGLAIFGFFVSGCAVLTLLKPESTQKRRCTLWQTGVLLFIAFDLGWAFWGLNPTVPAAFFDPAPVDQPAPGMAWYMPDDFEQTLKFERYFPLNDYRVAVDNWRELRVSLLPNLNMLDGVPMVNNFEPMVTQQYADRIRDIEQGLTDSAQIIALPVDDTVDAVVPYGERAFQLGVITAVIGVLAWGIVGTFGVIGRMAGGAQPPDNDTIIVES
jgi:hypothetical protein